MRLAVPRMNAEQARAWVALVATAQLLPAALDEQLTDDAGIINFEYGILSMLNVAGDQMMGMGELVSAIAAPYPRVSKAVSRLERRGFVERVSCVDDGRAVNVRLTRAGRQAWLRATPPHVALARDKILGGLSSDELETLASLLERVLSRLDPECRLGGLGAAEAAGQQQQPDAETTGSPNRDESGHPIGKERP